MKKSYSAIALLVLLVSSRLQTETKTAARPIEPSSTYVHGTIDVVIATREGFVMASDSRGSKSDGTHTDDTQKIFPVGSNAACVIAGLIGSDIGIEGFHLGDTIGTHLIDYDKRVGQEPVPAVNLRSSFEFGIRGVMGLLPPDPRNLPQIVGAGSAVSVSPDGKMDWLTFFFPAETRTEHDITIVTSGSPQDMPPLLRDQGFGVQAIGYPFIVKNFLQADGPDNAMRELIHSQIVKKFYERKRSGQLDHFTLAEAVELAKVLVETTIRFAPPKAGVGGPINILTVSKQGFNWVQKTQFAALPPPFRFRESGAFIENGLQPLDGLECFLCRFSNVHFTYDGNADVELVGTKFENGCALAISPRAKETRPDVVRRLKKTLGRHCQVTEDSQYQSPPGPQIMVIR
jgi:Proteasome subunit